MNITIINSHPKYLLGGAELFMYYCAKEFVAQGHTVSLVSIYPEVATPASLPSHIEALEGVTIYHLPHAATNLRSAWKFLRILSQIKTDVYIKMFTEPSTVLLAAYARLRSIPYVLFMAHDAHCQSDAGVTLSGRFRVGWLTRFAMLRLGMYACALRNADRILVQNELQKNLLKKNYQIIVDDLIKVGHPVPPESALIKDAPPVILWNARFLPWKRPELFLELARRLQEYTFLIGGPSPDEIKSPYFKSIRDAASLLRNVEIGVFPSTFEEFLQFQNYERASLFIDTIENGGFENTIVQALLRGVPIISVSRTFDGVLERERIGLGGSGDLEMVAQYIKQLLSSPDEWREYSKRARQFAVREYDIVPIASRVLKHAIAAAQHEDRQGISEVADISSSV